MWRGGRAIPVRRFPQGKSEAEYRISRVPHGMREAESILTRMKSRTMKCPNALANSTQLR
jgi:hypothetical protein